MKPSTVGQLAIILSSLPVLLARAFSSHTYYGKYFSGHTERSFGVIDWLECINRCHRVSGCVSYNFDTISKTCELNRHGLEQQCAASEDLANSPGWIFQQIRPVTKFSLVRRRRSCSCNCGPSQQCVEETGLGDEPEKAATSCLHILRMRGQVPNRAYYIKVGQESQLVYCHMTAIRDCGDEGGWTLVMKIDGRKSTFRFNSHHWTSSKSYNDAGGVDLSDVETKLGTFSTVTFQDICLGMKANGSTINWIHNTRSMGEQLVAIFKDPTNKQFEISLDVWKTLIPGSSIETGFNVDGFNVKSLLSSGANARIGIIGYTTYGLKPAESYIGFGTAGSAGDMDEISCGNVDRSTSIPTFGYILVK